MPIKLDFRSGKPIYVQIVDQIKHMIASGELKPGDQLPPVRELAADLQVNFNTIARAYRILDEAGILSTQHGRGTYILETVSVHDADRLRSESLEALTRRYLAEAVNLGFTLEELTAAFERYLTKHQEEK
jgi:GntR family transcriptional regulator